MNTVEFLPSSPPTPAIAAMNSKKRRRAMIDPIDDSKVLGLQKLLLPSSPLRTIRDSLCRASKSVAKDVADAADAAGSPTDVSPDAVVSSENENGSLLPPELALALDDEDDLARIQHASEVLRRSLMGLSLQLKLKIMIVEAWASDMNCVVVERNLFAIAKELAILHQLGVFEADTCVTFIEIARERMTKLLAAEERGETVKMDAKQMWTMALMQAQNEVATAQRAPTPTTPTSELEFPLLSGYDASSRDIAVLWNAMSIARERGAQLWHENKPEQALPFLVAADSYMKRFTLKYQRLKIDHAMLSHKQCQDDASARSSIRTSTSSRSSTASTKRVSFAAEPQVLGTADAEVDRRPISPTKPSKLESLLLRTSREFPTPLFD